MTTKEFNSLVRHMKKLVLHDISGITSSDVRRQLTEWLEETDPDQAQKFEDKVMAYQFGPTIQKLEREYQEL